MCWTICWTNCDCGKAMENLTCGDNPETSNLLGIALAET